MKTMIKNAISVAALSALTATAIAADQSGDHAVGASLNTFGGGFFYTYKINDSLNVRATINGFDDDEQDIELSNIDYEGDLDTQSLGAMVDWYPIQRGWAKHFFLSAGVLYYDFEYSGVAEATIGSSLSVGGNRLPISQLNNLSVDIEADATTPYLGIGWGNKIQKDRGISFVAELGIFSADDPDVMVFGSSVDGSLTQADLDREADDIADDLEGIGVFGSVGLSYHF